MKLIYLPALIILLILPAARAAEPVDNIMNCLKQGNAQELSKLFADNVEVTILNEDNVYTKTDAVPALDKFFTANKPKSVKLFHKVSSNPNYLFGVIFLTTEKGAFRFSFTLNKVNDAMKMIELRIETEKTK